MSQAKEFAARLALLDVPDRGIVGLGSGSTAEIFVKLVAEHPSKDSLRFVPSSDATRKLAESLGLPLLSDDGPWEIDIAFDGADEVDSELHAIKGGGGCLTREKIVIDAAKRTVFFVDESKLSTSLGNVWPVPVEVTAFGHRAIAAKLSAFGTPTLRMRNDKPFVTDQGGLIYDVKTGPIEDPIALEQELEAIAGVVCAGVFAGRAAKVIVGTSIGAHELSRS
jgi:ribose 5-phosphate isomerase A